MTGSPTPAPPATCSALHAAAPLSATGLGTDGTGAGDLSTLPVPRGAVLHVQGSVEHGDERGRLLGFPTANVAVAGHGLRDGVWAGTVQVEPGRSGPAHVAAVSIGHRPTYYGRDGERLLEAHLLDFAGDLYDETVLVRLYVRLRPQRRYAGSGELVKQLRQDVADTRAWAHREGLLPLLGTPAPAGEPS